MDPGSCRIMMLAIGMADDVVNAAAGVRWRFGTWGEFSEGAGGGGRCG